MSACPRCHTRFSGAARLCRNCGAELPLAVADVEASPRAREERVPFVPASVGLRTCPRCGRIVPAKAVVCASCPGAAAPIVVPPRSDGGYWGRVACDFRCSGCASWVPLAGFSSDGGAICVLCNVTTALPLFFWRVVLTHAHAVADLAGPDPEGRAPIAGVTIGRTNPYRDVGMDDVDVPGDASREDDDVPRGLRAGPGHPLCDDCLAPIEGDPSALACPRCKRPARSALPAVSSRIDRGLHAIVVTGGPSASATLGVVALRCPTCSGALTLAPGQTQATCRFCQTTSLVNRGAPSEPLPRGAFFLFTGPSAKRTALSKG